MRSVTARVLPNGLRVVLVPCEAESVAFGLFVSSGSRHEPERLSGISHFIEHMLFKGTPTRKPIDITRSIEGRGGNFNAYTGEESTCYYAHLPSEYLEESVDILSDMYLNATFPKEEFEREKKVVIDEIRMYADEPESVASENLQLGLFPDSALGRSVAGSEKTLLPMTADDLRAYCRSHYLPSNTTAVVVGAFAEDHALSVVSRALGGKCKGRRCGADAGDIDFSRPTKGEITAYKSDISQAQLALGFRTFGFHDLRKFAATVLDGILGRGMSSRLFQEIREKRGLSYDISSRMQFFKDAGVFSITAGIEPSKLAQVLKTIRGELVRISEKLVSARELKQIKEFLVGNFRLSHEKVTSKLFYYGQTMLAFGQPIAPQDQIEAIHRVSSEDVRAVARAIFRDENRCLSTVLPRM